jgi:prepilin-type N-terminal cleavage/methylation domain-containing protein/prepilin-type processing-associated H-X9-DG protein
MTDSTRRAAFTLVELLVVIGIIALLIAILLPSLNRAREAAKQVQCLSNMRSLGQATMMFASENNGRMPGQAGGGIMFLDGSGVIRSADATQAEQNTAWDWIAWQRQVDPAYGYTSTDRDANQNITLSGLAKYMGQKPVFGVSGVAANQVAEKLESVFRCPSDNIQARPKMIEATPEIGQTGYRYSYSMNQNVATRDGKPGVFNGYGGAPPALIPAGAKQEQRSWGIFSGKVSSIKNASEIILFVCEDEQTLDDGVFTARPYQWNTTQVNAVASRHQRHATARGHRDSIYAGLANQDAKGNVAFCDGHAEFFTRIDALRQRHSGNAYADPDTWPFAR